jgi:hypothetical protein
MCRKKNQILKIKIEIVESSRCKDDLIPTGRGLFHNFAL